MSTKLKIYKFLRNKYSFFLEKFRKYKNIESVKATRKLCDDENLEIAIEKLDLILKNVSSTKIYYIIRRDNPTLGLLTYVSVFLGHIAYALSKGYIPIIDMQTFSSIYLEESDLGKKNAWEFYFQQPCDLSLSDIPEDAIKIYSDKYFQPLSPHIESVINRKESVFWKRIAFKYVRLNDAVSQYVEDEYTNLICGQRVLGLLYRGTDYTKLKPLGHPIQPSVEQFIETIETKIEKWGDFDKFYLATDEQRVSDILERKFPGKILINKRTYYDGFKDISYLSEANFNRENDSFLKGLEYLSSIILLSRSESIIAGLCAGTYAANFLKKNNFKNDFYFNLGFYK